MDCSKLLFDTNAVVDLLGTDEKRPRRPQVAQLVSTCIEKDVGMLVSVGSLKDAYYIMRRSGCSHQEMLDRLWTCSLIFDVADMTKDHVAMALMSDEPDFEDGLIRVQAESFEVSAIVTDDHSAFASSSVPHLSAQECLETFWPEVA